MGMNLALTPIVEKCINCGTKFTRICKAAEWGFAYDGRLCCSYKCMREMERRDKAGELVRATKGQKKVLRFDDPKKRARAETIWRMKAEGRSFEEIGKKVGTSKVYAYEIYNCYKRQENPSAGKADQEDDQGNPSAGKAGTPLFRGGQEDEDDQDEEGDRVIPEAEKLKGEKALLLESNRALVAEKEELNKRIAELEAQIAAGAAGKAETARLWERVQDLEEQARRDYKEMTRQKRLSKALYTLMIDWKERCHLEEAMQRNLAVTKEHEIELQNLTAEGGLTHAFRDPDEPKGRNTDKGGSDQTVEAGGGAV